MEDRLSLRIGHLYFILALCAVSFYVSLTPTPPNDYWWRLAVGKIVTVRSAEGGTMQIIVEKD